MLKLGILGLGNCGNQLAELGKVIKNIPGMAINTSEKDIDNVENVDTIIIGDNKGAGKDRTVAKGFVRDIIGQLLKTDKFTNFIKEQDVIVVASSTGGGSGSGIAPMLTHLLSERYKGKKFILLHVLPSLKESLVAQQNTIEYLQEMSNFDVTYMSYDNGLQDHLPGSVMMQNINESIIQDLAILRGDNQLPTNYTSIDEKDAMKIMSTKGRLQVVRVNDINERDLDRSSIENMIINKIKLSDYITDVERDKIVKRTGIILNLTERINNSFDNNLLELKEFLGEPLEGFEHISILDGSKKVKNNVSLIAAGLSLPETRVQQIVDRITEIENNIKEHSIKDSVLNTVDVNTTAIRNAMDTQISTNDDEVDIDLDSIMSNYF